MKNFTLIYFIVLFSQAFYHSTSQAVMGIDFGGDSIKVSVITLSKPIEAVMDRDGSRRTSSLLAIKNGQLFFAEAARNMLKKNPECVVENILHLLGRYYDDPSIKKYRQNYPYLNMSKDPQTGGILVNFASSNMTLKPYELFSMWLTEIKAYTQLFLSHSIADTLLVMEPTIDQARLDAIRSAAHISHINLLEITDSSRALATQFIATRKTFINSSPMIVLLVDVGYIKTISTIAKITLEKIVKKNTTFPQFTINGIGVERIGTYDYDLCLKDYLMKDFQTKNNIKSDLSQNYKIHWKFIQESVITKKTLSANKEARIIVEDAYDYRTYQTVLKRTHFETECSQITEKIAHTITLAMNLANMSVSEIDNVILMGGGSTIPMVQEAIQSLTARNLSRVLNIEDSNSAGGSILGAKAHKLFRVMEMYTPSFIYYPIEYKIEYNISTPGLDDQQEITVDKGILYKHMSRQSSKRILTLHNVMKDFNMKVRYAQFSPSLNMDCLDYRDIFDVHVTDVEESINQYSTFIPSRIFVHFLIDNLRLLNVTKVELFMERNSTEGLLGKMGKAMRGFFGKRDNSTKNFTDSELDQEEWHIDASKNSSNETETTAENVDSMPLENITIPLSFKLTLLYFNPPTVEELNESRLKLDQIYLNEKIRFENAKARSQVAETIYETEQSLESELWKIYASEEELKNISEVTLATKEWYEAEGYLANYSTSNSKLGEITSWISLINKRVIEEKERQSQLGLIESTLNQSQIIVFNYLTSKEYSDLVNATLAQNILNKSQEIKAWLDEKVAEQELLKPYDKPVLTAIMLKRKIQELNNNAIKFYKHIQEATSNREKSKVENNGTVADSKPLKNNTLENDADIGSNFTTVESNISESTAKYEADL